MQAEKIEVGSTVRTKYTLLFVDATHPETGQEIETMLPRWHRLKVIAVDVENCTVDVQLPDGFVATLDTGNVEDPV